MAGTLYHGCTFSKVTYTGNDGRPHYEVEPVDGGMDVVSISSWRAIVKYLSEFGINEEWWPEFVNAVDVPLDDVREKCIRLRFRINAVAELATSEQPWLQDVINYLKNGEQIFFAEE